MLQSPRDRLRALASRYETEMPDDRAEQIAARALARADHRVAGRLRTLGARLEAGTRAAIAEGIAVRAIAVASQRKPRYVLRRVGAVAAAAVTFAIGAIGVGAIANSASPGDLLYGVDRAYETAGHVLGSKAPHTEERLAEALTLIDKGRSADAVALVDEAVKDYSVRNGLTDLEKTYADARSKSVAVTSTTAPDMAGPASPPTTVVAAPEAADPVLALRLAVEMLLRNVQVAGTAPSVAAAAVTDSALQAAAAASAVEEQEHVIAAGTTTTVETPTAAPGDTTTTTSEVTTTLTMPDQTTTTLPGGTTTTAPDETSTTTTTVPDGTSTTTTSAPDDGSGGIILPPQP